jgi:hypothetical protein
VLGDFGIYLHEKYSMIKNELAMKGYDWVNVIKVGRIEKKIFEAIINENYNSIIDLLRKSVKCRSSFMSLFSLK